MKKSLIVLVLLAGCGGREPGNNSVDGNDTLGAAPKAAAQNPAGAAIATTQLTGLYEGGAGPRRSQLCVVDKGTGNAQFGINIWGPELRACSGAGQAVRAGDRLTLTMAGDSSCTIEARIAGGSVTLPNQLPAGCAYYCGPGASFAGTTLVRSGTTVQDAMKAKDIADDPLCEG